MGHPIRWLYVKALQAEFVDDLGELGGGGLDVFAGDGGLCGGVETGGGELGDFSGILGDLEAGVGLVAGGGGCAFGEFLCA